MFENMFQLLASWLLVLTLLALLTAGHQRSQYHVQVCFEVNLLLCVEWQIYNFEASFRNRRILRH